MKNVNVLMYFKIKMLKKKINGKMSISFTYLFFSFIKIIWLNVLQKIKNVLKKKYM